MKRRRLVALLLSMVVLVGCDDGGSPAVIDWDLSKSHILADIGQDSDATAGQIESVRKARIVLPEGRVFEAAKAVNDIIYSQEQGSVDDITVSFERETAEMAYDRAKGLAKTWGLEAKNLDEWYADAKNKSGSEAADVDASRAFAAIFGDSPDAGRIGTDGPVVTVQVVYSFDDSEPWIVTLELSWRSPT